MQTTSENIRRAVNACLTSFTVGINDGLARCECPAKRERAICLTNPALLSLLLGVPSNLSKFALREARALPAAPNRFGTGHQQCAMREVVFPLLSLGPSRGVAREV